MQIKVLGTGCATCKQLYNNVKEVVSKQNLVAEVEYIDDIAQIAQMGIMSTPALVIDDTCVSSWKKLSLQDIEQLLRDSTKQ